MINLKKILTCFSISFLLSFSIYAEYFNISFKLTNSIISILAFYLLLNAKNKELFLIGFFVGMLWFYWISFSLRYYNLSYLIPLIIIIFSLSYGLFFYLAKFLKSSILKAFYFFYLSIFEPFNFNWFKFEVLLVDSYFGVEKYKLLLILLSLSLFSILKNKKKYLALLLLIPSLSFTNVEKKLPDLKIKLIQTKLNQDDKWHPYYRNAISKQNIQEIKRAIKERYEFVVLPESAFPLFLNKEEKLLKELKTLSHKIAILTGALYLDKENIYNTSYIFKNGKMQVIFKSILVPFGEYLPLPDFLKNFINKVIYKGAKDYNKTDKLGDFYIKNIKFRNAICYEASSEEIYKDKAKYIIATSNNAWFLPSIESSLQKILIKLYAKRYNAIVFHSTNKDGTNIIY